MAKQAKRYWLMKSEPDVYSIDDLAKDGSTMWEGVRNYQARNYMRDDMKKGDGVFFYHSNLDKAIVGVARVSKEAYPDPTQLDPKHKYFDKKAKPENPPWLVVEIEFVAKLDKPIELATLKDHDDLETMAVTQKFQRLSVQPVDYAHWKTICKMAGIKAGIV